MIARKTPLFVAVAAATVGLFVAGQATFAQQTSSPPAGAAEQSSPAGAEAGAGTETSADQPLKQLLTDITKDPKTAGDKLFLLSTGMGNRAEINLAKQVADKTQNAEVKKQAQQLAEDLQKENQQIMQTAQAIGLTIPEGMQEAAHREIRVLTVLPADQLDKRFTARIQARNARELSSFQSEAAIGQDPQVKQFAQQQIQAQQSRTQQWNQLAMGMGMPASGEAQPAGATIGGEHGGQGAGQQQPGGVSK